MHDAGADDADGGPLLAIAKRTVNSEMYVLTLLLLMSGDVESHPGPARNPRGICEKKVYDRQMAKCCNDCNIWTHRKCIGMPPSEYHRLGISEQDWLCNHGGRGAVKRRWR